MRIARHVKHASLALIALSSVGVLQGAYANGTPSGTTINNTATVDYSVGNVAQTQISAAASFVVDTRIDFNVEEVSDNATPVHPGQTNVVATFRLTNTGNGTQGFALTAVNEPDDEELFGNEDTLDVDNVRVFVDDGSGSYDGADTAVNVDSLATDPDGVSVLIFVVADIPAGATSDDYANVRLTAQATEVGFTTPLTESASDTAGVDIVIADTDRDNSETDVDQYDVSFALTITKNVLLISDPLNNTTDPKAIPGAVMQYTIVVTNTSTTSDADAVTVTDNIPANTTFVSGSIRLNTAPLPDTGNFQDGPPARVVVNAGTLPDSGGAATLTFQVTINE
jgi:uncharacterized repeat protein (TIGR01451 family)